MDVECSYNVHRSPRYDHLFEGKLLVFFYFISLFKKIKKIKIVHLDKVDDHLFEGELLVFWSHVVLPFRLDDALPVTFSFFRMFFQPHLNFRKYAQTRIVGKKVFFLLGSCFL